MGHIFGQELERHETVEPDIFSPVNHSHPAPAELFDNAVMRDGLAPIIGGESYDGKDGKSTNVEKG